MRWILSSSLRFGRLVVALAIGLMIFGVAQLRSATVDVYPQFTPVSVEIQTEALGLSAAEVEQLITVPIEQDLLNGVPWLDRIHSSSMPGLSAIDLTFQPGTNLYAARQMVQERMTQAHALPNVGMSSRSVSLVDMSVLARWKIRPRLNPARIEALGRTPGAVGCNSVMVLSTIAGRSVLSAEPTSEASPHAGQSVVSLDAAPHHDVPYEDADMAGFATRERPTAVHVDGGVGLGNWLAARWQSGRVGTLLAT